MYSTETIQRLSEQAQRQAGTVLLHRKTHARKEIPFIMKQAEAQGELVFLKLLLIPEKKRDPKYPLT